MEGQAATHASSVNHPVPHRLMLETVARALDASDDVVLVMQKRPQSGLVMLRGNDAFCRLTGIPDAAVPGRPLASLACPETAPGLLAQIEQAADADLPLQAEMLCRRADGGRFWMGLHVMPSADPGTGERHSVLLGRDITERQQARQQSHTVQQLLARVLNSVDVAVLILAGDGQIIKTNPMLDRLLAHGPGALEGRRLEEVIAPQDRPAAAVAMLRQQEDGRTCRLRVALLRSDGTMAPVTLTSAAADPADPQRFRILTLAEEPGGPERLQVAGKIRMIGLDEVKAVLGERWPALRERAVASAEHVLHRRLGPKDSFTRTRDDGFLICFAELAEEAASFTAAVIGREIRARLIGQGEEPEASSITAIAASVAVPLSPRPEQRVPLDILEARLNARREEIEAQARQTLADAMATATCGLAPVFGREGRAVVAHYARLPQAVQRRLATAAVALPPAERAAYDLDALTMRLAGQQALEQAIAGGTSHMFVDIAFEVFQSRATTDVFLESCRKLDPVVRQGFVMVLNHLPQGLTNSRMVDCVHRLRPFCRAVGFEIEEPEMPGFDLAMASSPFLVIDADRCGTALGQTGRLERLRVQLHAVRSRLLIRNVATRPLGDRLLTLGVDFVSAPAGEGA